MRSLDLNLASRPFRNNTLVWVAYIVLFAAAAGFTYWNVQSYRDYSRKLAEQDLEQGNLDQQNADLARRHSKILRDVGAFDRPTIGRRTFKANEVIEWKAFSWTRLFNEMSDVLPYGFKMTSIRPQFRNRGRDADELDPRRSMPVTVEGIARGWDEIYELETNLIQHVAFGRVNPRRTDATDNGELQFTIDFLYYPDEVEKLVERALEQAAADTEDPEQPVAVAEAAKAPAAVPVEAETKEVATAAVQPSPVAVDQQPPVQRLPQVKPETEEVTDEWAAQADEAAAAAKAAETAKPPPQQPNSRTRPAADPGKRNRSREPTRRTLPPVKPGSDDDDDGSRS